MTQKKGHGDMNNMTIDKEDEWFDTYEPVENTIGNHGAYSIDGQSFMFETYGEELDFVLQQPERNTWTWIEGTGGKSFICAGFHSINRIGYFVTTKSWADETETIVIEGQDQ